MPHKYEKELLDFLTKIVSIESPYFHEHEAINYVNKWLNDNGLPSKIHEYKDEVVTKFEGINAIGEITNNKPGPTILLNGHIDTVDLCEGWTKKPFDPIIEDGKMYGLGVLDMKSGVAAMLYAIKKFKEDYPDFSGKIKYHIVSDEEGPYGLGTNALIEDNLCDADVAIIPEPSAGFLGENISTICLGARGGVSYRVIVKGVSAHAASPEKGVNAIIEASKLILELKKIKGITDKKLGSGSTAVIKFEGGGAPASIADSAEFSVFRHMVIGETVDTVKAEVMQAAMNAGIDKDSVEIIFRDAPSEGSKAFLPYVCDENNEYIRPFIESVKDVITEQPKIDYFPSFGDFCYIGSSLNIPTIVYGPKGKNYHSYDEYVELDSYYEVFDSLYTYFIKMLNK